VRLGEILRHDGLFDLRDVDKVLRAQQAFGGRFGTNLIELGLAAPDQIANALSRQKGVPAARRKHFDTVDKQLLAALPRHLAERHHAIPIAIATKFGRELVVAFRDPDDIAAIDEIGFAASMRVRPSVAPEYLIIQYLDRLYGVPPRRFLRTPITASSMSSLDSGWDDIPTPTPAPAPAPPPPLSEPDTDPVLRIEELPEQFSSPVARIEELPAMLSADDAIASMAGAETRDEVGDAIVAYLMMTYGCGAVLICKKDLALGWRGKFPHVDEQTVESISIPLGAPSMFATAAASLEAFRGPPPADGDDLQRRLWKLLHCKPPREATVVPIALRGRVINLVYAHAADGGALPDADARLRDVCRAAGEAFVRLIQAKKGA
jgi:hypothetical protein